MNRKQVTLRVNREGKMKVNRRDSTTPSQCGKIGQTTYRYFVAIEGTSDGLDENGYLVDNAVIAEYFKETYEKKGSPCPSCEVMAQDAIEYFRKVGKSSVKITRVYVRIHGSDISFIEGEWKKNRK